MRCPARSARLLLLLLTLVSAREGLAQDLPAEIQKTMQMFSTRDLEQRNVARAELQKLLASYDPGKRKSATSALVAQSLRYRLMRVWYGIAVSAAIPLK